MKRSRFTETQIVSFYRSTINAPRYTSVATSQSSEYE